MENQFISSIVKMLERIELLHGKKGNEAYKTLLSILVNPCCGVNETCEQRRLINILSSSSEYSGSPIAKIIINKEKHRYLEFARQVDFFIYQEVLINLLKEYKYGDADQY